MKQIVILKDSNDNYYLRESYEVKDNKISVAVYDYESEYGGYNYEQVEVSVVDTYILDIHAKFIINPKSHNNSAYTISRGFREVNGLAYSYSINIIEGSSYSLFEDYSLVHTESGIKCTQMDMYSYSKHKQTESGNWDWDGYNEDSLVYEVFRSLDLNSILLSKYEKSNMAE